jgi:polysaccharide pyruvyl transferase WcaK-like protein
MNRRVLSRPGASAVGPRVGLFGLLGAGNLGNDGSLEAFLAYLRDQHPDARIDFLCSGPEQMTARYGVPAIRLHWNQQEYSTASSPQAVALKLAGKVVDAFRTATWVRRHDLVVVPGMGVLEGTLPLRPWGFPYSLLLLTASGRLVGTKVALVSVGANAEGSPLTRRVFTMAARLASYRSYRDELSRDAMRATGVDVDGDPVYPDLAFALPSPPPQPERTGTVGIGVMAYHGTNGERDRADEVYAGYVAKVQTFARWLLDRGQLVRLFTGDREDEQVADEVVADARAYRPDLGPACVVAEPPGSLDDLMAQMATVDTVVATRYHNVVCALKLSKPTISIGYSTKNDVLMADMRLAEFCQQLRSFDVDRLIEQYTAIESRRELLAEAMDQRNAEIRRLLGQQFAVLSAAFLSGRPVEVSVKEELSCE